MRNEKSRHFSSWNFFFTPPLKSNAVGYLHWLAPATVICDSAAFLSPHSCNPPPLPQRTQSTRPNQRTATPPTPNPPWERGSTRRTRERTREQEREAKECVGVIYLLFRFWSRVWKDWVCCRVIRIPLTRYLNERCRPSSSRTSSFLPSFQTPYLLRQKPNQIELRRKCRHSCFYHVYENVTVYYNKSQWCYCCKTVYFSDSQM